jgi:hypothetical protein
VSYILRWGEGTKWRWSRPVAARSLAQLLSGRVEGSSIFHVSTSTQLSGEPRHDVTAHSTTLTQCGGQATTTPFGHHKDITVNLPTSSRLVSSLLVSSPLFPSLPVSSCCISPRPIRSASGALLEPSCTQHRRGSCISPPAVIITAKGNFLFRAQTATTYHSDVSRDFQVLWATLIQSHCKRIDSSAQSPAAAASTTIVLEP